MPFPNESNPQDKPPLVHSFLQLDSFYDITPHEKNFLCDKTPFTTKTSFTTKPLYNKTSFYDKTPYDKISYK